MAHAAQHAREGFTTIRIVFDDQDSTLRRACNGIGLRDANVSARLMVRGAARENVNGKNLTFVLVEPLHDFRNPPGAVKSHRVSVADAPPC
jgi:hypothetical protein